MNKVKILFADDHALFRKSLIPILHSIPGVDKVHEAANGREVLDFLRFKGLPDLVLLDLNMPEMDGKETTAHLKKHHPEVKVIILSMYDNERLIAHMIRMGVNGYLLKQAEPQEVRETIVRVLDRGTYFNEQITELLVRIQQENPQEKDTSVNGFGEMELYVLRLITEGLSSQEIGNRIDLTKKTVDWYRTGLMRKTGTTNTASLVAYAVKNGLV